MNMLKQMFRGVFGTQGRQKNRFKPCILSKRQTAGMRLDSEIAEIYEPALVNSGVKIPLSEPQVYDFPLSAKEIAELKIGLRYVWCDGYESEVWAPRHCKYLGIRLSESFILHETYVQSTWSHGVALFKQKCHARKLSLDEFKLLNLVWDTVSYMRLRAEDAPLPKRATRFWIQPADAKRYWADDWADRYGNTYSHPTEASACLLLAVQN